MPSLRRIHHLVSPFDVSRSGVADALFGVSGSSGRAVVVDVARCSRRSERRASRDASMVGLRLGYDGDVGELGRTPVRRESSRLEAVCPLSSAMTRSLGLNGPYGRMGVIGLRRTSRPAAQREDVGQARRALARCSTRSGGDVWRLERGRSGGRGNSS